MIRQFLLLLAGLSFAVTLALNATAIAQESADEGADWRAVDPENILYVETATGRAVFELNADFAPNHVARLKELVRTGYYDGAPFYRVVDGFVAQFGHADEPDLPPLKGEFARPINSRAPFVLAQSPGFFATQAGFINGFPVGRDPARDIEYLVHCRGVINFTRDNGADTAVAHLAIMTGQAPRHLDNNISQVARVLWGMEHIVKISASEEPERVVALRIAADLPVAEQTRLQVMRTDTDAFREVLEEQRFRDRAEWFANPTAHVVDVCYTAVPVKLAE